MPDADGFEIARLIRQSGLRTQPRIIAMTAYGREAMEQALDLMVLTAFWSNP